MTALMEEYPDCKFSQSQCATYLIEERQNPEVFGKMRKFAEKGQWDITASTWVEGDLNMASGESIARHVLYSKKYLREKFGVEPRIMWCPDTFGHPGNLPQLLKKSGLDYYFHTRCGIGVDQALQGGFDYALDAHHVPLYWWRGQDGSRVLSGNLVYGREFSTRGVLRMSTAMRERFQYNKCMFVFGVGDHGGGPTRRDIAWMREISRFPTVPTLVFSTTKEFYDEVVLDNPPGLPERCGEMNFVFDGCYTTHADIKYYNRRCENDLEAVEGLCAMASLTGFRYPTEELEALWRKALFNQFHDILDGSGVKDTYLFSDGEARQVLSGLEEIAQSALSFLANNVAVQKGAGTPVIAYNPSFAKRDDCIFVPVEGDFSARDEHGATLPSQKSGNGTLVFASLPPMGYRVIYLTARECEPFSAIREDGDYYNISTVFYDIEIHKGSGRITTLYDKRASRYVVRRETIGWRLKNGCLNTLEVHYEEPTDMASWTIGSVRGVKSLIDGAKADIVEDGAVRKRIRFEHTFDSSVLRQDILIYPGSQRIDFETHVDWQEYGDFNRDAPMLRASFSPDIRNTTAVYEIPFGVIERFPGDYECPALRFADISGEGYGFALLNDSKYGYKCCGNRMELTLIRSGWLPDQKSDVGPHHFTYSILPHQGDYLEGDVSAQAAFLNNPVRAAAMSADGEAASSASFFAPDLARVPVCGVKRSEDGADIVVKLYNTSDERVRTEVKTCFAIGGVAECDFLEQPITEVVRFGENSFEVELGAREIRSYRARPRYTDEHLKLP
jgi:alpha-mannosidase